MTNGIPITTNFADSKAGNATNFPYQGSPMNPSLMAANGVPQTCSTNLALIIKLLYPPQETIATTASPTRERSQFPRGANKNSREVTRRKR